ncbi:MAG: O-antigen ligase family protein [Planctomycetota bacterium]|nr:O-antigen ligase family protein [Planctomycetota bacterium]
MSEPDISACDSFSKPARAGLQTILLVCVVMAAALVSARFECNPALQLTMKWSVAAVLAYVAVLAALLDRSGSTTFCLLDAAVLCWQGAVLVSVILSPHPEQAWMSYPSAVACGLIYLTARRVSGRRSIDSHARLLYAALGVSATLVAVYSLAQRIGLDPLRLPSEDANQFSATTINRNLLASFLAVVLPLQVYLLLTPPSHESARTGAGRVGTCATASAHGAIAGAMVQAIALSLCCAALILSRTRGAWLAAALGLGVAFALMLMHRLAAARNTDGESTRAVPGGPGPGTDPGGANSAHGKGASFRFLLLVFAVALTALAVMFVNSRRAKPVAFTESVRNAFDAESKSIKERRFAWQVALDVFLARPVAGSGYGTYQLAGQEHRRKHLWSQSNSDLDMLPRFAHNDPVQQAAETGIVGLVSLLFVLLATSCTVVAHIRSGVPARGFLAAAGASAAVVIFHGIVHYPLYDAPTAAVFWLQLGLIGRGTRHSTPSGETRRERTTRITATFAILVIGGLAATGATMRFLGAYCFEWAARSRIAYQYETAASYYTNASKLDPSLYYAYTQGALCEQATTPAPLDRDRTDSVFKTALAQAPHDEYVRFVYASFLEAQGDSEEALAQYDRARWANPLFRAGYTEAARLLAALDKSDDALHLHDEWLDRFPTDLLVLQEKGILLESLGRKEAARRCWEKVLEIAPNDPMATMYLGAEPEK